MRIATLATILAAGGQAAEAAENTWLECKGQNGPGEGKHVVLISGDEEYRSEEALAQLGKILATQHGFDCTVLFAIDPKSGIIDPNNRRNIPGLAALDRADLMIIFTRRRDLPDEQMEVIDRYLKAGKPVLGIRTATHAFIPGPESKWAHYSDAYEGTLNEWHGGFGRVVLGEHWVAHHGRHRHESTRGRIAPGAAKHPILRGIGDGQIWGPTDVYAVRLPLPGDSQSLVLGQCVTRKGKYDENDTLYGMRPDDGPSVAGPKNDPMMPIAWTRTYQIPGGKPGRAFTSTIGASVDLLNDATRRLLVNAVYWCVGLEETIPQAGASVHLVGKFNPTKYGSDPDPSYWLKRKLTVDELRRN
ncbi:MAG: ThuA domain-containing protein [Pirellulales bacterium]|nr:ThuA domain-containing protein [Pirellulales bacterium]